MVTSGGGRGEQLGKRRQGPSKAGILMLMCTQGHSEVLLTSGFSFSAFLVGAEGLHFLQAPGEANAAGREAKPSNHDGLAQALVTLPQYQTHSGDRGRVLLQSTHVNWHSHYGKWHGATSE